MIQQKGYFSSVQFSCLTKYLTYCILDVKIKQRHSLLSKTIGTKIEEEYSYTVSHTLTISVTVCMIALCILEVGAYFLFNRKVSTWKYKLTCLILLSLSWFFVLIYSSIPGWKSLMVRLSIMKRRNLHVPAVLVKKILTLLVQKTFNGEKLDI